MLIQIYTPAPKSSFKIISCVSFVGVFTKLLEVAWFCPFISQKQRCYNALPQLSIWQRSWNCQQPCPGSRWPVSGACVPRHPDKAVFVCWGLVRSGLGGGVQLNGHFVMTVITASVQFPRPSVLLMIPSAGLVPYWLCGAPWRWESVWPLFTTWSNLVCSWFCLCWVKQYRGRREKNQLFCCRFTLRLLRLLGGAVMIKSDIFSNLPTKNVGFIFQMKFALLRCQQGFFE